MAGQQICLKWNSFQSSIVTSFESLWEEQGFVDVTLASDGHCIQAHKIILSACSPFFKRIFQSNPCQHPVIILQDVRFKEIESLLSFIYKGEVNIDQKDLGDLLRAAETLQIRGLSGTLNQSKSKKKKSSASKKASLAKNCDHLEDEQPPVKRSKSSEKELPLQSSTPPPLTPFAAATPAARSPTPEPSQVDDPLVSDADSLLTPVLTLNDETFEDEDSMDKTARQAALAMDEMKEIERHETVASEQEIAVGSTFSCFASFKAAFDKWADAGHHPMSVHQSVRFPDNSSTRPYYSVVYTCKHYGKPRLRGKAIRQIKHSNPHNCPVKVGVNFAKRKGVYVVRDFISEHNHAVSAEQRLMYPDKRIPRGKDRETVMQLINSYTKRKEVLKYCHETMGMKLTGKDIHNLKNMSKDPRRKSRNVSAGENNDDATLQELVEFREVEMATCSLANDDHGYSIIEVAPYL